MAGRANVGLRSAAAAALVNYLATKTQQAVQGYLATTPGAAGQTPQAATKPAAVSAMPDSQVLPEGMTLCNGRYYLGPVLGRGSFGTTYRAVDQRLGRIVAIKEFFPEGSVRQGQAILPPPSLGRDGFEQERGNFIREAQILTKCQRPGIVTVYDIFEEHDSAYMVMEYVAGHTLVEVLRGRGGPLPPDQALRYMLACADALAAVHEQHLLHRDVKPGNIMITAKDEAVLIDFGAARRFDRYQRTSVMTAIGTPGYAPLEQWGSSGRFGPSSDVYALAATFYHLLTGCMPLSAADRAVQD
ncbi:MAG TPA: serine/threonine-protein kinase, partial [Dehalococcoidia bacterium]